MVMMLRTLWTIIVARWRPPLAIDGCSRIRMRVWPNDLDLNIHQNNGRYFSAADIGRFDWWLRTGIWRAARQQGLRPMAGDASARFSRPLHPFQHYGLESRLLGWDEKWLYSEHRFVGRKRTYAVVTVRYLFAAGDGSKAKPADVLTLAKWSQPSPSLPRWVANWSEGQDALTTSLRTGQ